MARSEFNQCGLPAVRTELTTSSKSSHGESITRDLDMAVVTRAAWDAGDEHPPSGH